MAKTSFKRAVKAIKCSIYNVRTNSYVSKNGLICSSMASKARGLMFTKNTDKSLLFIFNKERKISLHNFFVFYPIDVLWLSKAKKVVFLKEHFKPFTFISPSKKAMYVLEIPKGTIKKTKTKLGDTLKFLQAF